MHEKASRRITLFLLISLTIFLISACHRGFYLTAPNINGSSPTTKCRLIKEAMGEICIPTNPQRLVTLSITTLGGVLALNTQPIGSTNIYQTESDFPTYLKGKMGEIKLLGRSQPNLERMLLIKPDLIVGWKGSAEIYPLLSKIAPTVLLDWEGAPSWREHFNLLAEVLDKKEQQQQAWNHYYQRVEELKTSLGDRFQDKKISFIYFGSRGIESDVKNSFAGSILNDIGLQRPEAQNVILPYGILSISEEELQKADGDILFVATWSDKESQIFAKLKQKPLWKTLRAVQQNHVYLVDYPTWTGTNLMAADAVINDLFKYLINTP
jgi:iron complex transport system substrate-binding protein